MIAHMFLDLCRGFTFAIVACNALQFLHTIIAGFHTCSRACDVIAFTVKVKLQLNATNEIVTP